MTKVGCTGDEDSLFACDFTGWGTHNCSHSEDAAVICSGNAVLVSSMHPCVVGYH